MSDQNPSLPDSSTPLLPVDVGWLVSFVPLALETEEDGAILAVQMQFQVGTKVVVRTMRLNHASALLSQVLANQRFMLGTDDAPTVVPA